MGGHRRFYAARTGTPEVTGAVLQAHDPHDLDFAFQFTIPVNVDVTSWSCGGTSR
jgi:hypothetical protein